MSRNAQLVQNIVTRNSLIGTPKDYDHPYHLQEDYHLHKRGYTSPREEKGIKSGKVVIAHGSVARTIR